MSYTLFILMYFIGSKTKEIRRISMTNFDKFFFDKIFKSKNEVTTELLLIISLFSSGVVNFINGNRRLFYTCNSRKIQETGSRKCHILELLLKYILIILNCYVNFTQ